MSEIDTPKAAYKLGFWSACLTAFFSIAWTGAFAYQFLATPQNPWEGVEAAAASFSFVDEMVNLVFALPLSWAFVVMMVSLHYSVPASKRVWTMNALVFTVMYAVMADINYLIQLVTVRGSFLAGETEGLGLFASGNMNSVFWALANSYALQSIGLFFSAWAVEGGRSVMWIRRLWLAIGFTVPFQFAFSLGLLPIPIAMPALGVWIVGIPASSILLAKEFRQAGRTRHGSVAVERASG